MKLICCSAVRFVLRCGCAFHLRVMKTNRVRSGVIDSQLFRTRRISFASGNTSLMNVHLCVDLWCSQQQQLASTNNNIPMADLVMAFSCDSFGNKCYIFSRELGLSTAIFNKLIARVANEVSLARPTVILRVLFLRFTIPNLPISSRYKYIKFL